MNAHLTLRLKTCAVCSSAGIMLLTHLIEKLRVYISGDYFDGSWKGQGAGVKKLAGR